MNSPGDGFVPPRENDVERPTPPRGRFIAPRENDVDRFKECSSRNKAFSIRGKFTPLNDKAIGKVTFPRKKANKPIFQGKELRVDFQEVELGIELFL